MATLLKVFDVLSGLSYGTGYVQMKTVEDEVKQGKNYLFASGYQALELMVVSEIAGKFLKVLPPTTTKTALYVINWFAFLAAGPLCGLAGLIKQGGDRYAKIAQMWNAWRYCPVFLPLDLRKSTKIAASFFAEHAGDIARVGMIIVSLALIVFGDYYHGGAVFCALSYESLNTLGYVPRKISLFVETHKTFMESLGFIWGGGILMRPIGVYNFVLSVFPTSNLWLQRKIEKLIHKSWGVEGPLLEEVEAPLTCPELSFEEMRAIMLAEDHEFELNPAHLSKSCWEMLPENRDLQQFLVLFNQVSWETKAALILPKLREDQRFRDFLNEKFPDIGGKILSSAEFEGYIERLAEAASQTKEAYLAGWIKTQMELLVQGLLGQRAAKGSAHQIEEASSLCYKILPYLLSLTPHTILADRMAFEDALLKLAVEGGDYCGRGIIRVATELLSTVSAQRDRTLEDPLKNYEKILQGALQDERLRLMQRAYQGMMAQSQNEVMPSTGKDLLIYDVHFMDLFRRLISLGFYPLSSLERASIGIGDLYNWSIISVSVRTRLFNSYRTGLDGIVANKGELQFVTYFQSKINSNQALTREQKAALLELYTESNNGTWEVEETNHRAHRLVFMMLGILRRKPNPGPYDRAESFRDRVQLMASEIFQELRGSFGF